MRNRWILAGVLIVVGLVWMGQGFGLLQGSSFMTGDARWGLLGVVCFVGGALIGASAVVRRPKA